MGTKTKLVILELIEGLFGWVWIGATFAGLYFLAMLIFSDGDWRPVLWSFGIGAISKWLLRGFKENKTRVAHEVKLVEQGNSPKEAGESWTQEYLETEITEENPNTIIQEYGRILEQDAPYPGTVRDENKLPFSKIKIKEAIVFSLKNGSDPEMQNALKTAYISLSDWQPGVGPDDWGINTMALDLDKNIASRAREVSDQTSGDINWLEIVSNDLEQLKQELADQGFWSTS